MNSPEPAVRPAPNRSPARRIAVAVILSGLVFAVLWIMVFSMVTSLLIGAGCCVVIVAASSLSDRSKCCSMRWLPSSSACRRDRGDLRGDFWSVRILGPAQIVRDRRTPRHGSSFGFNCQTARGYASAFSRLKCARALLHFRPPRKSRAQGKPGARCTRDLVCNLRKEPHTSIQGSGGIPAFPARWVTAYFVLSPVNGFIATVAPKKLASRRT